MYYTKCIYQLKPNIFSLSIKYQILIIYSILYPMQRPQRIFDPTQYIQIYYTQHNWLIENTYRHFTELLELVPQCETALEIGCGPTLINSAFVSQKAKSIILSEYNMSCVEMLQNWKNDKPFSFNFDWKIHFEQIGKIFNKTGEQINQRVKESIQSIVQGDLMKKQIFDSPLNIRVDLIYSSLAYECACTSIQKFKQAIKNTKVYLKQGGHFILNGVLKQTYYMVKQKKLPVISLTQQILRETFSENGFQILRMDVIYVDKCPEQTSDFEGTFYLCAKSI